MDNASLRGSEILLHLAVLRTLAIDKSKNIYMKIHARVEGDFCITDINCNGY